MLNIALDHLSLGCAELLEAENAGSRNFSQAAIYFEQAVEGLRKAGRQDHIPHGLLARTALHRLTRNFPAARRDLDEAMVIAKRGSMRLHETDAHFEYARLCLAEGNRDQARQHLETARAAVARLGYHRRDPEVAELDQQLG